jgi:subtilase family serine protease
VPSASAAIAPQNILPEPPVPSASAAKTTPLNILPEPPVPSSVSAHSNVHLFVPASSVDASTAAIPAFAQPFGAYQTPASLACLYGMVKAASGCRPAAATAATRGGSKVVVVVDAFDAPTAAADLAVFSRQFGLPIITSRNFQVVYASGSKPAEDSTGGWALQASVDIEMVHALAPNARIVLVEAKSSQLNDLLAAETVAAGIAAKAGGGEVSNSWSLGEFAGEEAYEGVFSASHVVFFAATGDRPGAQFPAALNNVVAVGGTSLRTDAAGRIIGPAVWTSTGGGASAYVPAPSYQSAISAGGARVLPDLSLLADPQAGIWVYDSTPYNGTILQWQVVGGTGAAAPAAAALANNAGHFAASSAAELASLYANIGNTADFTEVDTGLCLNGGAELAAWNSCAGLGMPFGRNGS